MSYKYSPFGHDGASCICADPFDIEPRVVCELCGEVCNENFVIKEITHSQSIVICGDCNSQPKADLDEIIDYWMSYNS